MACFGNPGTGTTRLKRFLLLCTYPCHCAMHSITWKMVYYTVISTSEETSCRGQVFAPPMCNATAGRSPARPSAFPTDEAISPTMGAAPSLPFSLSNTSSVFSAVSKIVGNSRPRHALCVDFFDRGKAIKQEPAVAGPCDRALTVTTPLGASDMLPC